MSEPRKNGRGNSQVPEFFRLVIICWSIFCGVFGTFACISGIVSTPPESILPTIIKTYLACLIVWALIAVPLLVVWLLTRDSK